MSPPAFDVPADPYGLVDSAADLRPIVWFGDIDVSAALVGGQTNNRINTMASANLQLDARAPVLADIDFTSEVMVARGHRDAGRVFTGQVVEATVEGQVVKVQCQSHPALHDPIRSRRISRTFPVDSIHTLLREAGLPDARLRLAGLDQLPNEVFEAVSPINGLSISARVALGDVVFLPAGSARNVTELLNAPDGTFVKEFHAAQAYAVTYVTASRTYEAETAAIDRIDVAVAWANVRLRFSGAVTPAGQLVDWHRARLKELASRSELIALRGLLTNRCSLHHLSPPSVSELALMTEGGAAASLVASDARLRGAVKAAARAISSPDPLTKITAISECLEFYVGTTEAPYGFTRPERRALTKAAREFAPDKKKRVEQLLGSLNEAPLMRKLRFQLAEDGVPLTEGEMATLLRVRSQRNDVVHGKTDIVDEADVQQAVALLARIMVHASAGQLAKDSKI